MYKVAISSHAQRQMKKLSQQIQARLDSKILSLSGHPHIPNIIKLQGSSRNDWRLRVGDYRLLYEVDDASATINVFSVADRKEAY